MTDWPTLGLTAALVVITGYYAWQNRQMTRHNARMVEEMVRQNDLAIRPLLVTSIESVPGAIVGDQLVVRNIGNGPALYVRLRDLDVGGVVKVTFDIVDIVAPGATVAATPGATLLGGTMRLDFVANLKPRTANKDHDVTIDYEDIAGNSRTTTIRMGKSGTRLVRPS